MVRVTVSATKWGWERPTVPHLLCRSWGPSASEETVRHPGGNEVLAEGVHYSAFAQDALIAPQVDLAQEKAGKCGLYVAASL